MVKIIEKVPGTPDKRQVLIELSCASESCDPCTYPNCQRYVREQSKSKKPVIRRIRELSAEEFRKMTKTPRSKE
ncbi:MAG: hypothetical protein FJ149_03190 [Euryarchaeota archaeon]|nr:hypothetical protein [Euryarchaeota archaeon]